MPYFFDDNLNLESLVFQGLGAASTSWEHIDRAGIFDSSRCKEIGEELIDRIRTLYSEPPYSSATTQQLLDEIARRNSNKGNAE